MRAIFGALVALLIASTATAQTTIEQRNQWRRQAAEYEATASGLRKAAECEMPDFPSGWTYRKEVTPTAAPGSTLTNIPVAVTISADSDIAANALANGHDILFTDLTDGTTVYPSWRASYSAGTWKGFVLFPSYSSGDKCYVNYGNADASDQSTTAALTGGDVTHYLNFGANVGDGLTCAVTGAQATINGGAATNEATALPFGGWRFASGVTATFGAGQLQPTTPRTAFCRVIRKASAGAVFQYNFPSFPFALTAGNPANTLLIPTQNSAANSGLVPGGNVIDDADTYSFSVPVIPLSGGTTPVPCYRKGALFATPAVPAGNYNGYGAALTIKSNAASDWVISELIYLSGTRDANWHAFWHANTGAVTLSEQEEAVVVSVADLSVTDSTRYNLSVTDSARYTLTVADARVTDLTLGQEPTD